MLELNPPPPIREMAPAEIFNGGGGGVLNLNAYP
jgi:hypothetical protein